MLYCRHSFHQILLLSSIKVFTPSSFTVTLAKMSFTNSSSGDQDYLNTLLRLNAPLGRQQQQQQTPAFHCKSLNKHLNGQDLSLVQLANSEAPSKFNLFRIPAQLIHAETGVKAPEILTTEQFLRLLPNSFDLVEGIGGQVWKEHEPEGGWTEALQFDELGWKSEGILEKLKASVLEGDLYVWRIPKNKRGTVISLWMGGWSRDPAGGTSPTDSDLIGIHTESVET